MPPKGKGKAPAVPRIFSEDVLNVREARVLFQLIQKGVPNEAVAPVRNPFYAQLYRASYQDVVDYDYTPLADSGEFPPWLKYISDLLHRYQDMDFPPTYAAMDLSMRCTMISSIKKRFTRRKLDWQAPLKLDRPSFDSIFTGMWYCMAVIRERGLIHLAGGSAEEKCWWDCFVDLGEHNLSANKTRLSSEYDAFLSTYENKLVYAHLLGQVPQLIVTGETGAQEEWVKVVEKRVTFEAKKGRHPGRLRFDGRDGDLTYEAYEEVLDVEKKIVSIRATKLLSGPADTLTNAALLTPPPSTLVKPTFIPQESIQLAVKWKQAQRESNQRKKLEKEEKEKEKMQKASSKNSAGPASKKRKMTSQEALSKPGEWMTQFWHERRKYLAAKGYYETLVIVELVCDCWEHCNKEPLDVDSRTKVIALDVPFWTNAQGQDMIHFNQSTCIYTGARSKRWITYSAEGSTDPDDLPDRATRLPAHIKRSIEFGEASDTEKPAIAQKHEEALKKNAANANDAAKEKKSKLTTVLEEAAARKVARKAAEASGSGGKPSGGVEKGSSSKGKSSE